MRSDKARGIPIEGAVPTTSSFDGAQTWYFRRAAANSSPFSKEASIMVGLKAPLYSSDVDSVTESLRPCANLPVIMVRRIFFVHGTSTDRSAGPLELTFEASEVRLFDVGSDGETLDMTEQPWRDPFSGDSADNENQAWIARHGRWIADD